MKLVKLIFLIAITMALSITLTMKNMVNIEEGGTSSLPKNSVHDHEEEAPQVLMPSKRVSRFLMESKERNPRAADHCHKDHEVCYTLEQGGKNSTCCNNKCVDLKYDRHNCGACKKKCEYTETCCRGECVDVVYDKRHCGKCNNKCKDGEYCVYSMCGYA